MAKQKAKEKLRREADESSSPSRTRLIQNFRPYTKEQQVGKQPPKSPKGGRR